MKKEHRHRRTHAQQQKKKRKLPMMESTASGNCFSSFFSLFFCRCFFFRILRQLLLCNNKSALVTDIVHFCVSFYFSGRIRSMPNASWYKGGVREWVVGGKYGWYLRLSCWLSVDLSPCWFLQTTQMKIDAHTQRVQLSEWECAAVRKCGYRIFVCAKTYASLFFCLSTFFFYKKT